MKDLASFVGDLTKFGKAIDPEKLHKVVVLDVFAGVVDKTPIDTGRAKAGWQVEGKYPKSIVKNNVEYIVPLEEGHSSAAPQGMATLTVEEVKERIGSLA